MGQLRFHIPQHLDEPTRSGLERGYLAGLPDYMPWPTQCRIVDGEFQVEKDGPDSGSLYVPWPIKQTDNDSAPWMRNATRRLFTGTATLGERAEPYQLLTELARGKVNQVRNQAADWQGGGLSLSENLIGSLRNCSLAFARAVCMPPSSSEADQLSLEALTQAIRTGDDLLLAYTEQTLANKKSQLGKVPFYLSCGLNQVPVGDAEQQFLSAFNAVRLPFHWKEIEPRESSYQWEKYDTLIAWAKMHQLPIEGGPLIDLTPSLLPGWLDQNKGDVQSLANLLLDYLEATLTRYKSDITFWTIVANAQDPTLLAIDEEEFIWLNAQLLAAAKQIHPEGRFALSISQPWGEQLARGERLYSSFVFADALLRSRVELTALNIELAVGWSSRGSMLRDFLETSRMLDLYALLGLPMTLYLGMPAGIGVGSAYSTLVDGNAWSPELQQGWAARMVALAACKPYMLSVSWLNWSDAQDHYFPQSGVLDAKGQPRPMLAALAEFRLTHLQTP